MEKRRKISLLIGQGLILLFFVVLAASSASSRDVAGAAYGFSEGFNRGANGYIPVGTVDDASECIELCRDKGYEEWSLGGSSMCYCK